MATPAAREHPLEGGQEPGRPLPEAPRHTPVSVEPLRHVRATSRSVADSADEMHESSANVSAQAENIDRSMAKIKQGAEHQLQLVEKASALIARIADSIQSSARTAGAAAETA